MKVEFLPEGRIEAAALATLDSYGRRFAEISEPPVPVEEILECDLELDFGLEDLVGAGFGEDVLGAMWAAERRVRIDSSLDPTVYPDKEGRYRFTVGHEIGHWQLHRHLFLSHLNQDSLFGARPEPSVICRTGSRKAPIEWQADAFAARLLMPKDLVARAWEERRGTADPHFADEKSTPVPSWSRRHFKTNPTDEITSIMASMFEVSLQAMGIRLKTLGLIRDHRKEHSMFG